MTLLAEAKVQGSREERPGRSPETDGRLKQNLAYALPASPTQMPPGWAASSVTRPHGEGQLRSSLQEETSFIHRILTRLLIGSFVAELAIAELWLRVARRSGLLELLVDSHNLAVALAAGICLAAIAAPLTQLYFKRFGRSIVEEFLLPLFKGLSGREIAMIAILPGIGEEALFRGAIQPSLGLLAASLIFGLLHSGLSRRLLPYGIWTVVVGALLGSVYVATGNIWGSIVAHALINASGGWWMRRLLDR